MSEILQRIVTFLDEIGVPVRQGEVSPDSFLPGVRVERGALVFDPAQLRWPGDLLHEAGHIAVTPASLRGQLDDRLQGEALAPYASEVEAIAWSYAAVAHLGLDPAVLFHEGGYRGQSQALLLSFACGVYPGAFGLVQAGMTRAGINAEANIATYPRMQRWLHA